MKLSALAALHFAGAAFAFCPQGGQPRALLPSLLGRAVPAPQANGIKITSVNSASARAAARAANQPQPVPPPVPQPPVPQPPVPQLVPPPVAQPVSQVPPPPVPRAAATIDADLATVQLALDAAAAAAVAVLRSGEGDINGATVARIIAGFSAKLQEQLQQQLPAAGPPSQAPSAAPAQVPSAAPREPKAAALDKETLTRVLAEFVRSPYAKQLFDECNVQPLIGSGSSMITVLFKSLALTDAKLVVSLNRAFEQRSDRILEQLVKHLRARMPPLERLQYEASSPPTTRTIIL